MQNVTLSKKKEMQIDKLWFTSQKYEDFFLLFQLPELAKA